MAIFAKKKYLELAKGFRGRAKNCPRVMMPRVEKSLQHAYKGRRLRPRIYRQESIMAINAASREHGVAYNQLVYGLNNSNIQIDRKILANLAVNEPFSFKAVLDEVRTQVGLRSLWRDDMDFSEAVDKNFLVYGPVKPLAPPSRFTIPYLQARPSVVAVEKDKIKVINRENYKDV